MDASSSILIRVAAGNFSAVQACMNRYGPLVWSLARRYTRTHEDAEDATQEIFMEVWKSAGRYDPARGSEAVFIAVLARRRLIDRLRTQSRQPKTESLGPELDGALGEGSGAIEASGDAAVAAQAIASLPPRQRDVVLLATVEGWTHAEIAEAKGLPIGTVKTFIRRGLLKVREVLVGADHGEDDSTTLGEEEAS